MLSAGTRLGPYEIVDLLGSGGMGEVYRARDRRLGRQVAIKLLPQAFANDPDRLARFEREARAVAALSHPNILAIHDYGTLGQVTYAVTELLEGQTLGKRLERGPIPWTEAAQMGAAIADGLSAAHERGIVHRDLKPENLFLTSDGRVKILDFGLARMQSPVDSDSVTASFAAVTQPGLVMGTPGYMSPEQVRGEPVGARSDLFALGCVLYEMITGKSPFARGTAVETMTAILREDPPELYDACPAAPLQLSRLVRSCLARMAPQRPQSAIELALALRAISERPAVAAGGARATVEAVAVLPFENVSGDSRTEPLSDGIADHLINSLSQVKREGLKVRPFSSASRYKRHKADVTTMGRELNVQMLISGTLQKVGRDLWVSVALIDAQADDHLWGKR